MNNFKELFNDEHFNQLWSKYELDDDTYDVDDAYIVKRAYEIWEYEPLLLNDDKKDKKYELNTLVKMFNKNDKRILSNYYFDYTADEHHIKMFDKE